MVDVKCLSDCKLQNQLEKLGFSPGPILRGLQKHQAPESHMGLSPKREATAWKTRLLRAGKKKVSQWA
ncbi:PREDICTED: LEM domain-containing protein 1 isoform X4 [Colobus angolensis palliatus]|uniref:LEM domain-containing protein n=1 Tax=Colobus angolensis palliatus TaxID=336983 RepID=A0A2K5J534_COLAP|nr:PREDICTED: LEM domain-containing protein 1 isoform X4 [Colobus angolensis palliatus]